MSAEIVQVIYYVECRECGIDGEFFSESRAMDWCEEHDAEHDEEPDPEDERTTFQSRLDTALLSVVDSK